MASDFHTHNRETGGTALISSPRPIPGRLSSLELHPWSITDDFSGIPAGFSSDLDRCAALGEVGYDALRGNGGRQLELLPELLDLALRRGKPVVLHLVRPQAEVLKLLERYPLRYLVHGFRGRADRLAGYLDRNWYVSLGVRALDDPGVAEFLRFRGLERVGFETDDDPGADIRSVLNRAASVLRRSDAEPASDAAFTEFLTGVRK